MIELDGLFWNLNKYLKVDSDIHKQAAVWLTHKCQ